MDQATRLRMMVNQHHNEQKDYAKKAKVVTVTSGKGGVGKTNITINTALTLAQQGKKVVILDADLGLSNIEVLLGVIPTATLSDLIFGQKNVKDILTSGPLGVQFISSGSGVDDLVHLNSSQIQEFINKLQPLEEMADIVLIDTGAGVSDTVMQFIQASDETVVVVTPEPTSITDAYALIKTVRNNARVKGFLPKIHLLVNRADTLAEGQEVFNKIFQASRKFLNMPVYHLGSVPYDRKVIEAVKLQKPFCLSYPDSAATKAIRTIGRSLIDLPHEPAKNTGLGEFMKKLFHLIG
ncbi:MAG: MinD/ParA family protein [Epulopiscium sp.]|nr:MinD/ParA family protein [Candidatus Epulonipiscium sp.]